MKKSDTYRIKHIITGTILCLVCMIGSLPLMEYELKLSERTYKEPRFYMIMMSLGYPVLILILGILLSKLTTRLSGTIKRDPTKLSIVHHGISCMVIIFLMIMLSVNISFPAFLSNIGISLLLFQEKYPVIYILLLIAGWIWDLTSTEKRTKSI